MISFNKFNFLLIILFIPLAGRAQYSNIGQQSISYTDESRQRPVKAEIWYPSSEVDVDKARVTPLPFNLPPTIRNAKIVDKQFPTLFISHGTGGNGISLAWLAIELAKSGYVVVAPDHFGNTYDNKIPEFFVRYWERPLDISFLLSSLLNDETFSHHIDPEQLGMLGFSLGGYTSLALAGVEVDCIHLKQQAKTNAGKREFTIPELGDLGPIIDQISCDSITSSYKDDRFQAFVAMAPALGLGLSGQKQNVDASVLIIGAMNDQVAPYTSNALKYHELIPGSELMKLKGKEGHYVFLNEAYPALQKQASTYYKDDESVKRAVVHKKVLAEISHFLTLNLKHCTN